MDHTVEVDKGMCISSGRCVADYPSAFGFDDEELAETLPGVGALTDDQRLAAARGCPAEAIRIRDAAGDEVDLF